MLIKCPECGKDVSDKANFCVHCGLPKELLLANSTISKGTKIKGRIKANTKRKHVRLPNGYGTIRKLSGNRRKPFVVYPHYSIQEYSDEGRAPKKKALGYFETYTKAMECLAFYNKTHGRSTDGCLTFGEVYEKYIDSLENDTSEKKKSQNTIAGIKSHYKKCSEIKDIPMNKIYKEEMQSIIDNLNQSYSSVMGVKKLFNAVFKYAIENGIIEKDYAKFVHVKKKKSYESGEPFTISEIKTLWKNKSDPTVQTILILLYSGMRISELQITEIDYEQQIFSGGMKTLAGKNRIIPWHNAIIDFVEDFNQEEYNPTQWRAKYFYPKLEELGMATTKSGKKHTPHDLRHTFSWLCDKYQVDELSKYIIIGHMTGDVDKDTYGHRTLEELKIEINKIKAPI